MFRRLPTSAFRFRVEAQEGISTAIHMVELNDGVHGIKLA